MPSTEPAVCRVIHTFLKEKGVLHQVKEIQHARKFTVSHGRQQAVLLVYDTGTIVVQGRPSGLHRWLQQLEIAVTSNRLVPPLPLAEEE
jgi:hypothetical protein